VGFWQLATKGRRPMSFLSQRLALGIVTLRLVSPLTGKIGGEGCEMKLIDQNGSIDIVNREYASGQAFGCKMLV
jgi:hypothetical protein